MKVLQRASGILMPISSLYGEYGCGSFSESAYEFVDFLSDCGFKSMSVFQFGFDGNPNNPHLPHSYNNSTVAFTGTHDNNTLLGFMWELENDLRQKV